MNIEKLVKIIKYDTELLYWILLQEFKQMGLETTYAHDDWIYIDNNHPIMLVAHIDTVTRNRKLKVRVRKDRIKARNSVLGADDRAGIYAILEILKMCKESGIGMPSILITNYEEVGLVGASEFCKADVMNKNMNLFIELDRRGYNEYVYYSYTLPNPIHEYISQYGYVEKSGSMSDVDLLTEKYKVPHLNLSVGYYDQHSVNEILIPSQLQFTIDNVFNMIKNPITELHEVDDLDYKSYYYGEYISEDYHNCNYMNKFKNKNYNNDETIEIVPVVFKYNYYIDTVTEVEYESCESDINWEDTTDEHYYNEYTWGY